MRAKVLKIVISFYTTADAMATEVIFLEEGIGGRFIPVPRQMSAGCGIAWAMLPEEYGKITEAVKARLPEPEQIREIMI